MTDCGDAHSGGGEDSDEAVGGEAMTGCGDAHAGGGEDNGEAGEIRRGLGGGLTRGATSRGEIRQWVIIERS